MVGGQRKKERVQQRRPRHLRPPGRLVGIPSGWASSEGWDGRGRGDALRRLHAGCGHNPALQVDGSTQIGITRRPSVVPLADGECHSCVFDLERGTPALLCVSALRRPCRYPAKFPGSKPLPAPRISTVRCVCAIKILHWVRLSASVNPTPNSRCRRNQGGLASKSLTI